VSANREHILNAIARRHADEDWKAVELYILGGPLQPETVRALARILMSQAILLTNLAERNADPPTPDE